VDIYLEIGEHGNLYCDWDSEFSRVDGVWLVKDGLPDLEITAWLSPGELESAQQVCIAEMEKDAEYARAEAEDYADYMYQKRKDDILSGDWP
jgi:hypothetical protein